MSGEVSSKMGRTLTPWIKVLNLWPHVKELSTRKRGRGAEGWGEGGADVEQCHLFTNKAFRHLEILFVHGNIFVLNQNKPPRLIIKKEVNNS